MQRRERDAALNTHTRKHDQRNITRDALHCAFFAHTRAHFICVLLSRLRSLTVILAELPATFHTNYWSCFVTIDKIQTESYIWFD